MASNRTTGRTGSERKDPNELREPEATTNLRSGGQRGTFRKSWKPREKRSGNSTGRFLSQGEKFTGPHRRRNGECSDNLKRFGGLLGEGKKPRGH